MRTEANRSAQGKFSVALIWEARRRPSPSFISAVSSSQHGLVCWHPYSMIRTFWTIVGSGRSSKAIEDTKGGARGGPKLALSYGDLTDAEEEDMSRNGSTSSFCTSSGDSDDESMLSQPASPILPPSPALCPTVRRPAALRRARPRCVGADGVSSADVVSISDGASSSADAEGGLRRLQNLDPELHEALTEFLGAFRQSSLRLCMRLCTTSADYTFDIIIDVGPEGAAARSYDPSSEWPVSPCTISCERDVLIQIIRGETSPMNALLAGAVVVDDLGQLMAFSTCFDFEAVACCAARKKSVAAAAAKGGELVLLPQEGLLDQEDLPAAYEGSGWIAEFEPGLVLI